MTRAEEYLRLAERCEAAAGPDREMDAAIALAQPSRFFNAGPKYEGGRDRIGEIVGSDRCVPGNGSPDWLVPRYTASLDAALTLVPDDMRDEIEITTLYQVARVTINMNHGPDGCRFYGSNEANSIPLAICAAALKARAALEAPHA